MKSPGKQDLPTLTEVVDLTATPAEGELSSSQPMPVQDESVALDDIEPVPQRVKYELRVTPADTSASALAYDEELVAQVMVRLQPRLEAWVEARVRHALLELLPVWTESAALSIVRDLRAEMPELLSVALDEVHRHRRDKPRG